MILLSYMFLRGGTWTWGQHAQKLQIDSYLSSGLILETLHCKETMWYIPPPWHSHGKSSHSEVIPTPAIFTQAGMGLKLTNTVMQQGIKMVVFKMPISWPFTTVQKICTARIQYLFFIHLLPIFHLCAFAVDIPSSNKCITLQNKIEFHPILLKGVAY